MTTGTQLRDYQTDMVAAFNRAARAGNDRMYGVLPTGCGKTRVASELIHSAVSNGRRVLWIVHTRELVKQAAEAISERLGDAGTVGIVMADQDECDADVIVGSIQTLRPSQSGRINRIGPVTRLVIDECHHVSPDNTYAELVQHLSVNQPGTKVVTVGITATPFRADKKAMQEVLPYCAYERTIPDMIQDGWLCNLRYKQVNVASLDLSEAKMSRRLGELDLAIKDLAPAVERDDVVLETVYETIEHIVDGRPALAFCASVHHAQLLAAAYRTAGVSSAAIWGDMPTADREQVLRDWRTGQIQLVTNCAVLTEGFDFPRIGAVIVARPTLSVGLYTQMIGRGTRLADGKPDCVIIDITGRMPAKATPIDLADIVGEDLTEPDAEDGTQKVPGKKDEKEHRPKPHALRDPYGRARFAWTEHPYYPHVWFAPVAVDLMAVLIPDPKGSGLFAPYVVPMRGWDARAYQESGERKLKAPQLAGDWSPRRQAIANMEMSLSRSVQKSIAHSNRSWRNELPSPKQMQLLQRLDRNMWQMAESERWSKGDVSLAINAVQLKATVASILRANEGVIQSASPTT